MAELPAATTLEEARAAKEQARELLGAIEAEIAGLGIIRSGEGYGIKVNLRRALPAGTTLPSKAGKVPLVFEVVGEVTRR